MRQGKGSYELRHGFQGCWRLCSHRCYQVALYCGVVGSFIGLLCTDFTYLYIWYPCPWNPVLPPLVDSIIPNLRIAMEAIANPSRTWSRYHHLLHS